MKIARIGERFLRGWIRGVAWARGGSRSRTCTGATPGNSREVGLIRASSGSRSAAATTSILNSMLQRGRRSRGFAALDGFAARGKDRVIRAIKFERDAVE